MVCVSNLYNKKTEPTINVAIKNIVPIRAATLLRRLLLRLAAFSLSASGSAGRGLLLAFPRWGAEVPGLVLLRTGSSGGMGAAVLERLLGDAGASANIGVTLLERFPGGAGASANIGVTLLGRLPGGAGPSASMGVTLLGRLPGGADSSAASMGVTLLGRLLSGTCSSGPALLRTCISNSGSFTLLSGVRASILCLLPSGPGRLWPFMSIITDVPPRLLLGDTAPGILPAVEPLLARGISFSSSFDISINSSSVPIFSSFACSTICIDGF